MRPVPSRLARVVLLLLIAGGAGETLAGCKCTDPASTPVEPDCPGGRKASATVNLVLNPAGLRPDGANKKLRVLGTRLDTDACIQEGAASSFTKTLEQPSPLTDSAASLGPGAWRFTVTALSGGDYASVVKNQGLAPGSTSTLTISAGPNQALVVGF